MKKNQQLFILIQRKKFLCQLIIFCSFMPKKQFKNKSSNEKSHNGERRGYRQCLNQYNPLHSLTLKEQHIFLYILNQAMRYVFQNHQRKTENKKKLILDLISQQENKNLSSNPKLRLQFQQLRTQSLNRQDKYIEVNKEPSTPGQNSYEKQYITCFSQKKPETLVFLQPLKQMKKLFIQNTFQTQFISIAHTKDKQWEQLIKEIQKKTQVCFKLFDQKEKLIQYIKAKDCVSFVLLRPSQLMLDEEFKNISSDFRSLSYTRQSRNVDEKKPLPLQNSDSELQQNCTSLEQLCIKIKNFDTSKSTIKKNKNFLFVNQKQVNLSYRLIKIMYAMLNQNIDHNTHCQIVDNLQKLYCELEEIQYKQAFNYFSSESLKKQFFLDLKSGITKQKYIQWYTRQTICNYKVINNLLRSARHPFEVFYVQPYFKHLFNSIKDLYAKKQKKKLICYRGVYIESQQLNDLKPNKVVVNLGFLSTTTNLKVALKFGSSLLKIFVSSIQCSTYDHGFADISNYSYFYQEEEILFNPLNSFRVKGNYYQNGLNVVQLEYGIFSKLQRKKQDQLSKDQMKIKKIAQLHLARSKRINCQGDTFFQSSRNLRGSLEYWKKYEQLMLRNNLNFTLNEKLLVRQKIVRQKIGRIYYSESKFRQAIQIYKQISLERFNQLGQYQITFELLNCLINLATIYKMLGKYDTALKIFNFLSQRQLSPLKRVDIKNRIGNIFQQKGLYEQASQIYQSNIDFLNVNCVKSHFLVEQTLINQGNLFLRIGKLDAAQRIFKSIIQSSKQIEGEKHQTIVLSLNNIGTIFYERGQYQSAVSSFTQCIEILKKSDRGYPKVLNNLGLAKKKVDKSRQPIKQSLKLKQEIQKQLNVSSYKKEEPTTIGYNVGKNNLQYAKSLNNFGVEQANKKNYSKAKQLFNQSGKIVVAKVEASHPLYKKIKQNIVYINLQSKDLLKFNKKNNQVQWTLDSQKLKCWLQFVQVHENFSIIFERLHGKVEIPIQGIEPILVFKNLIQKLRDQNRLKAAQKVLNFMHINRLMDNQSYESWVYQLNRLTSKQMKRFATLIEKNILNIQILLFLKQEASLILGHDSQICSLVEQISGILLI